MAMSRELDVLSCAGAMLKVFGHYVQYTFYPVHYIASSGLTAPLCSVKARTGPNGNVRCDAYYTSPEGKHFRCAERGAMPQQ